MENEPRNTPSTFRSGFVTKTEDSPRNRKSNPLNFVGGTTFEMLFHAFAWDLGGQNRGTSLSTSTLPQVDVRFRTLPAPKSWWGSSCDILEQIGRGDDPQAK